MPYNLLTCAGFAEQAGWVASSACLKARIGVVIIFFMLAMIRKWGGEEIGISFNFLISLVAGILSYLIIVTITGSFKIAFLVGLVAGLVGGYGGGMFFESEGGE